MLSNCDNEKSKSKKIPLGMKDFRSDSKPSVSTKVDITRKVAIKKVSTQFVKPKIGQTERTINRLTPQAITGVVYGKVITHRWIPTLRLVASALVRIGDREFEVGRVDVDRNNRFQIRFNSLAILADLERIRAQGEREMLLQVQVKERLKSRSNDSARADSIILKGREWYLEHYHVTVDWAHGRLSPYGWTYYQDEMILDNTLNEKLRTKLASGEIALDSVLLLAARSVTVRGDFALDDCDLVIVADKFDSSNGKIILGVSRTAPENTPGDPGRSLTITCKDLKGINIFLKGGEGGTGLKGQRGETGHPGCNTHPNCINGGTGGRGKTGGEGATGGIGGKLLLRFVTSDPEAPMIIDLPGGDGGDGGPGGDGGKGGMGGLLPMPNGEYREGRPGKTGPPGFDGRRGSEGPTGLNDCTAVTEDLFWATAKDLSGDWAEHRLSVGEYYYRAYNRYTDPATMLKIAYNEFESALRLNPLLNKAERYRSSIVNAQNVLGLEYDLDIVPDFPQYENIVAIYAPLVNSVYESAALFAGLGVELEQLEQSLQREIDHLRGSIPSFKHDLEASKVNSMASEGDVSFAQQRITDFQNLIQQREEEFTKSQVSIAQVVIGTGFVVAIVLHFIDRECWCSHRWRRSLHSISWKHNRKHQSF